MNDWFITIKVHQREDGKDDYKIETDTELPPEVIARFLKNVSEVMEGEVPFIFDMRRIKKS